MGIFRLFGQECGGRSVYFEVLEIFFKQRAKVTKRDKIIRIYARKWQAQLMGLKAQLAMT